MAYTLRIKTPTSPNVHYHGKVLPRDAAPPAQPVVDDRVNYHGKELPRDAKLPDLIPPDHTNNPSLIIIQGLTLPGDTSILIDGEKILARDRIFDGIPVIEHIAREASKIEFEGIFRYTPDFGSTYPFPQDVVDNYWTTVFLPNSVLTLTNTYLNRIGIMQLVVEKATLHTVRGSTNVPFRMITYENIVGQSLIVQTS